MGFGESLREVSCPKLLLFLSRDREDEFLVYVYMYIFGCAVALFLRGLSSGFSKCGLLSGCRAQASCGRDPSWCDTRSGVLGPVVAAPGLESTGSVLRCTGLAAPRQVGFSRIRD